MEVVFELLKASYRIGAVTYLVKASLKLFTPTFCLMVLVNFKLALFDS